MPCDHFMVGKKVEKQNVKLIFSGSQAETQNNENLDKLRFFKRSQMTS